MSEITATDAARRFADLLDSVEHEGERFTITRHGRVIAQIEPATSGGGRAAKDLLNRHRPDPGWAADVNEVRDLLVVDDRR